MAKKFDVLLADDDVEDQDILKEFLLRERPGLAIHTVLNGKEALSWLDKMVETDLPNLIILDYKMPVLNAVETLEFLQRNPAYAIIPTVVWSTSIQNEHKSRCLEFGASFYFTKPTSPSDLKNMVLKLLTLIDRKQANTQ